MKNFCIFLLFSTLFFSCRADESNRLIIWTDRPEFAFYVEYFNSGQDLYKAEVRYFEFPSRQLSESGDQPDIVIAGWLNSASVRNFFRPLDEFFEIHGLESSSFYSSLLSLGRFGDRQLLIPVSFNLPSIVFSRDLVNVSANPFIMELDEIMAGAKAFNVMSSGSYTALGFSPLFNNEFLYIVSLLYGAEYNELFPAVQSSPISWNAHALESSLSWFENWFDNGIDGIRMEDDFVLRYFVNQPDRLINTGRILYTYMDSSGFFTLPEERRMNLNFRWIGNNEIIPISDSGVFFGIHRRTQSGRAAEAFTIWFFSEETQRNLLEVSRDKRLNEMYFGVAGGFSAMRTVTEQIFPQFYPALLGHTAPEVFLSSTGILPRNWTAIKDRVIIPYLNDRIRNADSEIRSLDSRINDWYRLNRD